MKKNVSLHTIFIAFILVFAMITMLSLSKTSAIMTCFGCTDSNGNICCSDPGGYMCATLIYCQNPNPGPTFGQCVFGSPFAAYSCNGGAYQCSACTDVPPTDGGGPSCGPWGEWGACNPATLTQNRCQEGVGCPCESQTCVICTPTAPGPTNLISPANTTLLPLNSTTLTWDNAGGGWGNGCPNDNTYRIRYKTIPNGTTNCSGGGWQTVDIAPPAGSPKTYQLNALSWNSTYCWRVRKRNGSMGTDSNQTWTFRTPPSPQIISSGFIHTDVCGAGISGRTDSLAAVTNPVRFEFVFNKPAGLNFQDAYIAFLPTTGPYAENANFQTLNIVNGKVSGAGTLAFRLSSLSSASPRAYSLNKTSAGGAYGWYGGITSGTQANSMLGSNTSDLLNINTGTGTSVTVAGNQATIRYQMRLENVLPSGTYNVYVLGVVNGASTGSQPGSNAQYYTRVATWRVDMTNPSPTISSPQSIGTNRYRMTFSATDGGTSPSGIKEVRSYAAADKANTQFRNDTRGYTLTNLPAALGNYPAASNGGINQTNLGINDFTDLTPALFADYSFRIAAVDNACNAVQSTAVTIGQAAPWLLSAHGAVSVLNGFSRISIPNVSFTGELAQYSPRSVLSTDTTLLNNNGVIDNTVILQRKFDTQYNNKAMDPKNPQYSNWYDYLYYLADKNKVANFYTTNRDTLGTRISNFDLAVGGGTQTTTSGSTTFTAPTTTTGSSDGGRITTGTTTFTQPTTSGSTVLNQDITLEEDVGTIAGVVNAKQYYLVNNANFRILSGTVCDQQAIIFVNGNLTIEPDFTNSSVDNGCIFVVKGNVTIDRGTAKTAVALGSATPASYDEIQAFIIATGTLTVLADNGLAANKWDGLRIVGGIYANQLVMQRSLNTTANDTQPAYLVIYDPRYRLIFDNDLANKSYSLREN